MPIRLVIKQKFKVPIKYKFCKIYFIDKAILQLRGWLFFFYYGKVCDNPGQVVSIESQFINFARNLREQTTLS